MVGRKSSEAIGPDDGDIDGQNGFDAGKNGQAATNGNDGTIDGRPVASIDNIAGNDGYARDESGNVLRNKDGSPRKKRGRKPGSGGSGSSNKQSRTGSNKTVNDAVDTLSKTLLIVHAGLANFMKFDEMALDEQESNDLANATVNVLDQFDFEPDPRITAVMGLVTTASMIYGPRYIIYRNMKKKETTKNEESNEPSLSVVPTRFQ